MIVKLNTFFYKGLNIVLFVILLFIIYTIDFGIPGPDAEIYIGLAKNIINGIGYYDTITIEEILPPIGHPFFMAFFLFLGFSYTFFTHFVFFLSILIFILIGRIVLKRTHVIFGFVPIIPFLFYDYGKVLREGSVEVSLLFSILLFWLSLILVYKYRSDKTKIKKALYFFSLTLFVFIIVRPLFLPIVFIVLPIILIERFIKRDKSRLILFFKPSIFLGTLILTVFLISNCKYTDSRLLTGTYSSVTLYSAYNNYLKLDESFNSRKWNKVTSSKEVIHRPRVLLNSDGWKNRDKRLKKEVTKFIFNHPLKALKGYLWRLSKYTFDSIIIYKVIFWIWLFFSFFAFIKLDRTKPSFLYSLFYFLIVSYIICLQSVFPFVGARYYFVPLLFMGLSILGYIQIFIENKFFIKRFIR